MICPNCCKENNDNNLYCSKCGSPLNRNNAPVNKNGAGGVQRVSLNKAEQSTYSDTSPSQSGGVTQRANNVVSNQNKGVYCSNCGTLNSVSSKFCNNCGAQMGQTATRTQVVKEKVVVETREDAIPTLGIVSLVMGIIAFCCSFGAPVVGIILAIIGDICGAKSHTAMGTGGSVLSTIAIIICIIQFVIIGGACIACASMLV